MRHCWMMPAVCWHGRRGQLSHGRRPHRTGDTAAAPEGRREGRSGAQPRSDGCGGDAGLRLCAGWRCAALDCRVGWRVSRSAGDGTAGDLGANFSGRDGHGNSRGLPEGAGTGGDSLSCRPGRGGGSRDRAGRGLDAELRSAALQTGARQSGREREECFFAACRGASGQVSGANRGTGVLCRARDRGADRHSADERGAVSGSVCRDVQPAGRGRVDFSGVGRGRLPDGVAHPGNPAAHVETGYARRIPGDGRQSAGESAHSRPAAADAAAADEGGRLAGFGGGDESDALCGGAELRFRIHGAAARAGEGPGPAGGPDSRRGTVGRGADRREPTAGPFALPPGGAGAGHSL